MKKRTFTSTFTFPAGTTAGQYEKTTVLDSRYDRANGVAAYVNSDGGVPSFKLGLRSDADVYVQPTNVEYFKADASCPKNQRMTSINILCDKQNVFVQFTFPQTLESAFNVDVVFELEG